MKIEDVTLARPFRRGLPVAASWPRLPVRRPPVRPVPRHHLVRNALPALKAPGVAYEICFHLIERQQ